MLKVDLETQLPSAGDDGMKTMARYTPVVCVCVCHLSETRMRNVAVDKIPLFLFFSIVYFALDGNGGDGRMTDLRRCSSQSTTIEKKTKK